MEKLKEQFTKVILPELKKSLSKKNNFEVPQIEKVIVAIGIGDYKDDKNGIAKITAELTKITGQKPKTTLSRKAVSAFKLRVGQTVGLMVTLRGDRMYDFITRLVNVALPRVRDFRGLKSTALDGQGNFSIGIKDYSIFPEIKYEDVTINFGLQVTVKTTAKNKEDAKLLLTKLGFPFEKGNKKELNG
jgi:large subunit ribosomal protein L5